MSVRWLARAAFGLGLVFCRERGLEARRGWLTTLEAEAALVRGRWDEAGSTAATILAWPAEGFTHSRVAALVTLARPVVQSAHLLTRILGSLPH